MTQQERSAWEKLLPAHEQDRLDRLRGQRAETEDEYRARMARDGHLMANAKPTPDDYQRMRNANPYAAEHEEVAAKARQTSLISRLKSWLRRMFGAT